MALQTQDITIQSGGERLEGHLVAGAIDQPGVLFVHGWDSDQRHYQDLSREVAALGCTCLTFDLRGHGASDRSQGRVSRADNLIDVLAAYDALSLHPGVDGASLAVVGTSYGGYLAALATRLRPVRWLALRVPALYPDTQWEVPKNALDREMLQSYRQCLRPAAGNRCLTACQAFQGDVLLVESANDSVVPHPSIQSFANAFTQVRSMAHHCISGADHALSMPASQQVYAALLIAWFKSQVSPADSARPRA
ncbi:alpha/beta hydrolase family protein [Variovorax sp. RT4R15]|uniref:alpha/beta hydrolase family protein n=1 Tax=Variovorax sp. RT4R15 TaxID=3443737 RepID=UPI003F460093